MVMADKDEDDAAVVTKMKRKLIDNSSLFASLYLYPGMGLLKPKFLDTGDFSKGFLVRDIACNAYDNTAMRERMLLKVKIRYALDISTKELMYSTYLAINNPGYTILVLHGKNAIESV